MAEDQVILNPALPGNQHNSLVLMLQRKADNTQEAYQAACFWWQLLTINPHLQPVCRAQIEAQWGWAQTNATEAATIAEKIHSDGKAHSYEQSIKEAADFWAAEAQVLLGRADAFKPEDAPVWATKRLADLQYLWPIPLQGNGMIVALMPSIGRGGLLLPLITQLEDGTQPLNIIEDRTLAQLAADGDLPPPPSRCKNCGAVLVFVSGKHNYTHCIMCSDPARYYLIRDQQGNWQLDPNPPTPKGKKGTVS